MDRFLSDTLQALPQNQADDSNNSVSGQNDVEENESPAGFQPTVNGDTVDIDPDVLNESLIAISARNPLYSAPQDATERNSFLSLVKPEISAIKMIDKTSIDSVRKSLLTMSSKSLALKGSILMAQKTDESSVSQIKGSKGKVTKSKSQIMRSHVQNLDLSEEEEYDDVDTLSEDSDEGMLVGTWENSKIVISSVPSESVPTDATGGNTFGHSNNSLVQSSSTRIVAAVSSRIAIQPITTMDDTSVSQVDSVKKKPVSREASNTSVRSVTVERSPSGNEKHRPRSTSNKSEAKPSSNISRGNIHQTGSKPTSKSSIHQSGHNSNVVATKVSTEGSSQSVCSQQKSNEKMLSQKLKSSQQNFETRSHENMLSQPVSTEGIEDAKSRSSILLMPRKISPEPFPSDDVDIEKVDTGSSQVDTTTSGTPVSTHSLPMSRKSSKNSKTIEMSSSGKTIEMTSSGTYPQQRPSIKNSGNSEEQINGKAKSIPKDNNPRPSSGYSSMSNKRSSHISNIAPLDDGPT